MDDDGVTRLGIEYDQGSVSKAVQTADQIQRSLDKIGAAAERIGSSSDKMGHTLTDALKGVATYTDADAKALDTLRSKLDGVAASAGKVKGGSALGPEGLRRTGGALSQLGFGEIGFGVSRAGDVAQIGKEFNTLTESLGPLGLALPAVAGGFLGLQIGLKLLDGQLKDVKQGLQSALDTQKGYYEFAATATTQDAENRKKQLVNLQQFQQQAVDETENALRKLESETKVSRQVGMTLPGALGDPFRQLTAQLDSASKAAGDTGAAIGRLEGGLQSAAFAANDAAKAEQDFIQARIDSAQHSADQAKQFYQDDQLTSKAAQQKIDLLRAERDATAAQMAALQPLIETSDEAKKKYDQLNTLYSDQTAEIDHLTTSTIRLATAREDEAAAIKKTEEAVKKQADYITKQNQDIAQAYTKYEDDVKAIEEKSLQRRADIEKQYADKQIEIARQAADAAKTALQKLEQARADLATNLGRDEEKSERAAAAKRMDIQISAQREEAKAYQDHQRELEQIRKDAQAREIGFLLDRNFLGLYQSRLQTSQNIDRANQRFVDDRQTRQQGTQQQLQDLQTSLARERQERLIAYQQQLADAQRAYQREIQQAQAKRIEELTIARQKRVEELNDLMATTRAELNARRQKAIEEINMARLTSDARIKLLQAEQAAAIKAAYALTSGASGGSTAVASGGGSGAGRGPHQILRTSAYGNALNAGDWSTVNDRFSGQREQYGGIPLPGGLGLFFAMKPGNVTAGGGSGQNTFYITSHDPQGVRREVLGVLEKVMD